MSYLAVLATTTTRVHLFALLFILLVAMIVVVFIVIALVVIFRGRLRPDRSGRPTDHTVDSPQLVLARRLASGEIDEDEYRRRVAALHGHEVPPPA